ncbi:DNA-formamidopyrimidine glycosylase [Paenibacillus sp. J2TS4]|uniref:DNA-formamidopyrimidine glycosylase n=1 Tax=Paenibacillus sp. J2TS4 TaxID=2807194 RepID=UPI001B141B4D|nr:DNA-formamidopyrimidine glycosylase [Paenibacillus sp. J2TS4]GIP33735.1 formamidopyrimidine-DNA glycosylase [Paenibacillus sp. J2TS4]
MPELPEVETVVRTLNQLVKGKHISDVSVHLGRIIQRPSDPEEFCAILRGRSIIAIERRGKFLRFLLDGLVLVSHLRMEGRYGLYASEDPVEKHTHVVFHFDDGTELRYKDVRQFGTMHLFSPGDEFILPPLHKLGLEPLAPEFTLEALRKEMAHRSTKIKPLLLNQERIAGIGNIYADEALFRAGIHPERTADSLTRPEWLRLHEAIIRTLQEAVDAGGSSIKSYVNGQGEMGLFQQQLNVYGRKEQGCNECGHAIVKTVLGGRGTHYCPNCQPPKKRRRAGKAKASNQ